MKPSRYNISFPAAGFHQQGQNEVSFLLKEDGQEINLRFHDYAALYNRPGLYEQLFYDRLRCCSPRKISDILTQVLRDNRVEMSELRVLDLGAGNGMMGELLHVARVVGVDISPEAYEACERDRPGEYDAYYVTDFCNLDAGTRKEIQEWQIDCLTCVAALGFGDIPTKAFATAYNLVATGGWVAFNIKETFLQESDNTGFSRLVKHLLLSDSLEVHHLERYRHRISIDGQPLFYYALVGRKEADISQKILQEIDCA